MHSRQVAPQSGQTVSPLQSPQVSQLAHQPSAQSSQISTQFAHRIAQSSQRKHSLHCMILLHSRQVSPHSGHTLPPLQSGPRPQFLQNSDSSAQLEHSVPQPSQMISTQSSQ